MKAYNREFFSLAGVAVVGMLTTFLMTMTDQLVASHMLGETALAGIGLAHPVNLLVETFTAIFYVGTGVRLFAAKSTGSKEAIRKVFSTSLFSAILGGLVFAWIIWCFRWSIIEFFDAGELASYYCMAYLKYYAVEMAILPVSALMFQAMLCEEDTVLAAAALVSQLVVNVVASILLCRYLGIDGIALGSVLGFVVSILVCLLHFRRKDNVLCCGVIFSPLEFWRMVVGSVGDMCYPFFQAVVATVVTKIAILRFGDGYLPLVTVMIDVTAFAIIFEGLSQALDPVIGGAYAKRDFETVNGSVRTATWSLLVLSLVVGGFVALCPGLVLDAIGVEMAMDPAAAEGLVRIMGAALFGIGFVEVYNTAYQYVDHPVVSFWLTLLGALVGPVGAVAVVSPDLGFTVFAAAFAAGPYLGIAVFFLGVLIFRRGRSFPLLLSRDATADVSASDLVQGQGGLPFRVTRGRIALVGVAIYVIVVAVVHFYISSNEIQDAEFALKNTEWRYLALEKYHPSREDLAALAANTYLISDGGVCALLKEDGVTLDCPGREIDGRNIFTDDGYDRAAVDARRTFSAVVQGNHALYRIFTVNGCRLLLAIFDDDIYWSGTRETTIIGIMMLIIIAALVFITAANMKNEEGAES